MFFLSDYPVRLQLLPYYTALHGGNNTFFFGISNMAVVSVDNSCQMLNEYLLGGDFPIV